MGKIRYQSGIGNHFETEAEEGALPVGQNSPQKAPLGLYAEQLSGTSFLSMRHENLRSWLYRIQPSVVHSAFQKFELPLLKSCPFDEVETPPDQLRWSPLPDPEKNKPCDFLEGLVTICGNGTEGSVRGSAVHLYSINRDMRDRYFFDSDGELLIVPQQGRLKLCTEFGTIELEPLEIAVVPRGVKFKVDLLDDIARGYVCENYGPHLRLPYLGPIGANGLANPRDFLAPTAAYEKKKGAFELITKFNGSLWRSECDHSPLDVVAWHGNYYPYKYDLRRFNVINTVSNDHPDPSIFTVLSSPSEIPGMSNLDFVIFPPRWMVAENTFRPPYYHRNFMSEYMGLIEGVYDAKQEGFLPGGGSLHNCMSAHGPDTDTFEQSSKVELKPVKIEKTMAFMFESSLVYKPTRFAMETELRQKNYQDCWSGLKANFELVKSGSK